MSAESKTQQDKPSLIERAGLAVLHRLDPERAHDLSLRALAAGVVPEDLA
ncbi:MAG: hypothetical protein Q4G36_06140 [Paracoccus sp. (in: a-proteobacteria)]|nr:hypothetical protein [Paracoccus sp. (in: a-proteobacteria)]